MSIATFALGLVLSERAATIACPRVPAWPQTRLAGWCDVGSQEVTQAEAERVIDRFLGARSGAEPERAWGLLTAEARSLWPGRRDFVAEYEDDLWTQRLGQVRRIDDGGTANRFSVTYETFLGTRRGGEVVNELPRREVKRYSTKIQVVRTSSVVSISSIEAARPRGTTVRTYPWLTVERRGVAQVSSFGDPSRSTEEIGVASLASGGRLRPFCALDMPDGKWFRTAIGWVPDEYLEDASESAMTMYRCDPHLKKFSID